MKQILFSLAMLFLVSCSTCKLVDESGNSVKAGHKKYITCSCQSVLTKEAFDADFPEDMFISDKQYYFCPTLVNAQQNGIYQYWTIALHKKRDNYFILRDGMVLRVQKPIDYEALKVDLTTMGFNTDDIDDTIGEMKNAEKANKKYRMFFKVSVHDLYTKNTFIIIFHDEGKTSLFQKYVL